MKYPEIQLIDNKSIHNFELWVDGHRSFIDYQIKGDKAFLLHTEVPKEQEGQGIASALVEKTLMYLEENKLKLVPLCSYVRLFLERHPEWNRLVAEKNQTDQG
jgi:predicted GNAT family acetyltransferase